ncbi:hypothetical protein [Alloactinosynnema sp. L-07]|uniref:hypothetical protein n=1 Tax=Alloactinosynnema sp. L-07 TaxID=1653480 RepID=UPI00065F0187|nr:hypothetical protein [Alloactinosynnema sp. L-07]CRK58397.1 hypothetical protein [Alloactinosynnema sp. L-07]
MWTPEAVEAEVNYRRNGTMDRTSRLHLREVRQATPVWWQRMLRHRGDPKTNGRSAA